MAGTYTAEIIQKNKNHILNMYKGHGGKSAFIHDMEHMMKMFRCSPQIASGHLFLYGMYLTYNDEILRYLHRLGLKDDYKIERYKYAPLDLSGAPALYAALMARDGGKLYEELTRNRY